MKSIAKVSCLCLALGYGFSYTHAATARVATAQQDNTRVQYTSNRPQERLFVSNAVEKQIKRVKSLLTNARLAWMQGSSTANSNVSISIHTQTHLTWVLPEGNGCPT